VLQTPMLLACGRQIAASALEKRLPTVYGYREHVVAGGLKITTACEKFRLRNCRGQYLSAHCVEIQRYGSSLCGLSA